MLDRKKNFKTMPMFIAALLIIVKSWEQPRCPLDEWISKRWSIHTWNVCYSSLKRRNF